VRQEPPCRSRPQEVENGVDQLARRGLPWSPTGPSIRDHGRDHLPLSVGQIGIVAPPRWRLPLWHRVAARVVSPTPYESRQATLGILLKRALRRTPPDMTEIKPPKAPSTGYVLYLIDKRKHYKNLPFQEVRSGTKIVSGPQRYYIITTHRYLQVTKLLGNEWTRLDKSEKKFYLDKAEIDKKRYREELRVYRKSEAYQTYLRWKRMKRKVE
jgi:hypothetical protein